MDTVVVVGSFENEPDIEIECQRVYAWRNWNVSHLEEIRDRLFAMWDEKSFAFCWLETEDVYPLDPIFIEEKKPQKLSLNDDKGKSVAIEEEIEIDEERFQPDLQQAMMVSHFETTLPQGEPSRIHEEEEEEEELVDYKPFPNLEITPTKVIPDSAAIENVDDEATSADIVVESIVEFDIDVVDDDNAKDVFDKSTMIVIIVNQTPMVVAATISKEEILEDLFDKIIGVIAERVVAEESERPSIIFGLEGIGGNLKAAVGLSEKVPTQDEKEAKEKVIAKTFEKGKVVASKKEAPEKEITYALVAY